MTFPDIVGGNICRTCPRSCCGGCGFARGHFHWQPQRWREEKTPEDCETHIPEAARVALREFTAGKGTDTTALSAALGYKVVFDERSGFLTGAGCGLDRKHRSETCLAFRCGVLGFNKDNTDQTFDEAYRAYEIDGLKRRMEQTRAQTQADLKQLTREARALHKQLTKNL